jgi:hypothetical protein
MPRVMSPAPRVDAAPDYGWRDRAATGGLLVRCTRAGERCVAACDAAFLRGFELVQSGHWKYARAIRLCQDCAALCEAAASLAGRDSELAPAACEAAADACYACAAECERFPGVPVIAACAAACRACAASCREVTEDAQAY